MAARLVERGSLPAGVPIKSVNLTPNHTLCGLNADTGSARHLFFNPFLAQHMADLLVRDKVIAPAEAARTAAGKMTWNVLHGLAHNTVGPHGAEFEEKLDQFTDHLAGVFVDMTGSLQVAFARLQGRAEWRSLNQELTDAFNHRVERDFARGTGQSAARLPRRPSELTARAFRDDYLFEAMRTGSPFWPDLERPAPLPPAVLSDATDGPESDWWVQRGVTSPQQRVIVREAVKRVRTALEDGSDPVPRDLAIYRKFLAEP